MSEGRLVGDRRKAVSSLSKDASIASANTGPNKPTSDIIQSAPLVGTLKRSRRLLCVLVLSALGVFFFFFLNNEAIYNIIASAEAICSIG